MQASSAVRSLSSGCTTAMHAGEFRRDGWKTVSKTVSETISACWASETGEKRCHGQCLMVAGSLGRWVSVVCTGSDRLVERRRCGVCLANLALIFPAFLSTWCSGATIDCHAFWMISTAALPAMPAAGTRAIWLRAACPCVDEQSRALAADAG